MARESKRKSRSSESEKRSSKFEKIHVQYVIIGVAAVAVAAFLIFFGLQNQGNEVPQISQPQTIHAANVSKAVEFLSLAVHVQNVTKDNDYFYRATITGNGQTEDVLITSDGRFILFKQGLVDIETEDESGIQAFIEKKVPEGTSIRFLGKKDEGILTRYDFQIGAYTYSFYLTPDGKLVLPGAAIKVFSAPVSERPKVMLFVMAFCPFGQGAEKAMKPVYDLLKDKVDFEIHYVIYPSQMYSGREDQYCMGDFCSMHGVAELREDVRQMCIQKYYPDVLWDYVYDINTKCSLSNIDTCWQDVAKDKGIDVSKIQACFESEGMALLSKESELDKQYNAMGSPTLIINGVLYDWTRSSNAYKWAICSTFASKPEECNTTLESNTGVVSGKC